MGFIVLQCYILTCSSAPLPDDGMLWFPFSHLAAVYLSVSCGSYRLSEHAKPHLMFANCSGLYPMS